MSMYGIERLAGYKAEFVVSLCPVRGSPRSTVALVPFDKP